MCSSSYTHNDRSRLVDRRKRLFRSVTTPSATTAISSKPYHVSAIISTRLFSDNNMKDETVSTDEESRIANRRIQSQQPTISTKTTTATNNNNINTLDTTVHVRIPGQAFIIVLAVTLFWPTLAGVRIWWNNNHNHNHPASSIIQTRTFQSRPASKPSLSTNNNHNLPNFDQTTIPSKSLAPKEPPSSSAGLLDDKNDDSDDNDERNHNDEILELPRLSPAEQIVGAVFGPPTGTKQYGQ